MTKLKPVFFALLALVSVATSSALVEAGRPSPDTPHERRLGQICDTITKTEGEGAIWTQFFTENLSEDVRGSLTTFNIDGDCAGTGRVTFTVMLLNTQTQIDLYLMENSAEKNKEGTEFKFNCYTFESRFGDNNFFSAQCVEIMEEGEAAFTEIMKRIKDDLAGMLRYIVGRMNDALTADMVAKLLEKHWTETHEIGSTSPDVAAAVKTQCPGQGGKPARFKVTNQNTVDTPGKISYQLTLTCGSFGVQLTADIFLVDGHYVRVRIGSSTSSLEFDWAIFDQTRNDKIEASKGALKTKDIIVDEFNLNHKAELDAFVDSALSVSAKDKSKLIQSQLTFPEFVFMLDKVLVTTSEREAANEATHLTQVTRVSMETLNSRPKVHNLEESEGQGEESGSSNQRRFSTYEPFDYFVHLSEDKKPGVVNFGKFFGEIDLASMSLGKASLYCTFLGIEKDCEVGKPLSTEVIKEQSERFHQNLIAKTKLVDYDDPEAKNFAPKNPNDYFPLEMAYSVDELHRLLLVKVWQLSSSCLAGGIILFKTQFFVLEYIVPFLDADSTQAVLGFLVDNVLDHYAHTVAETHDEISKATLYALDDLKLEIGKALNKLADNEHVCGTKISGNGVDAWNIFSGKAKGGKKVGEAGEISDCEGIESDEMTPIVRVQTSQVGTGFDLQVLLNHEAANGLPLSTKYHINKSYPYQYSSTLQNYLVYMLGLISKKEGKRYEWKKDTVAKMLGKKEVKGDELRQRRILKEKLTRKLAKQRHRLEV